MSHNTLILYTGPLCHLCDEARRTVFSVLPPGISVAQVDINTDQELQTKYSYSIPVLVVAGPDGRLVFEKSWPFSPGQVRRAITEFIASSPD